MADIRNLRQRGIFGNFDMPAMSFSQASAGGYPTGVDMALDEEDIPTLRSRRIFDPYQDAPESPNISTPAFPEPPPPPQVRQPIDWEKEEAEARGLYSPEDIDTLRYRNLLDNVPERNKPGWARKLVAGGMGLGEQDPMSTMDKVLYAPYDRDMIERKAKAEPFYNAANLERQSNINELTLSRDALRSVSDRRKQDEAERRNLVIEGETARKNREQAEIARQRNEVAALVAQKATFHTDGDRLIAMFPDGTTADAGPSHNFSPLEIAGLNNAARQQVVETQGQTQRDVAQINNDPPPMVVGPDGKVRIWNPATRAYQLENNIPPGGVTVPGTPRSGTGNDISEIDLTRRTQRRLREAPFTHPEWAEFVDDSNPTILKPKPLSSFDPWFGGIDPAVEAQYKQFIEFVYGNPAEPGIDQGIDDGANQGGNINQGGQQQQPPPPPPRPPQQGMALPQQPVNQRALQNTMMREAQSSFIGPKQEQPPNAPSVFGAPQFTGNRQQMGQAADAIAQQQAQQQQPQQPQGQGYYEMSPSTGLWRHTWDGVNWMYYVNGQWTPVAPQ